MAIHVSFPSTSSLKSTQSIKRLRVWAWATLVFFVVVVLEGAVVRATSSGAGCGAHWPLCNGEILPHHPRIATIIEFTHRSLTGFCSMMFLVLITWTFLATSKGHPARRASVIAGLLLVSEALLGAVLVLKHWVENNVSPGRVIMQSVHFTNTLLLLGATTVAAVLLSRPKPLAGMSSKSSLRLASLLALAATVLTGATGSLAALADTVFPSPDLRTALAADFAANSPLLIRMRWMHPAAALLTTACAVWLAFILRRTGAVKAGNLLLGNVALQLLIGVADVLLLAPIWVQVLHLLSADVFWISLVALTVPVLLPGWTAKSHERAA